MRGHDIESLVAVGRPSIAPDGSFAVFATARPDVTANRSVGQVWRVDLPDGPPRRLTRGAADSAPELSPDGTRVAFLRGDTAGRAQIFMIPAAGGEPVQATDAEAGVLTYSWSPDAASLAYTSRVAETGRYGTVKGLDAVDEAPRRITGIRWHANGLGYVADRPAQLFRIAAPDPGDEPLYEPAARVPEEGQSESQTTVVAASARQLTDGESSWTGVTWTPDGAEILTVPDEIEADRRDLRNRLVAVAADGSGSREIVGLEAGLTIDDVAVSADGAIWLLAAEVGASGVDFVAPGTALWLCGAARRPERLTDAETIDLGEPGSRITLVGDDALVQDRTRGRVRLLRVTRAGAVEEALGGDVDVLGHAAAAGRIVVAIGTADSFGELALVTDGAARPLTGFAAPLREAGLAVPREVEITARDGYPVHGWVATPAGEGPFPVILQVHGGPYASYGIRVFDETQVLVDAGYAVVYCNPRGSAGYGRAHGRAIRQAMGTVDYTDIQDFLDGVLADDDSLDGDRVGIMGGSYGGYMTAWTIAHDHRFAAAIVERGMLDPATFAGTSDIGTFFGDEYVGTDPAAIARQSPMAVVGQVTTPTLVIHSELDYRCPLEQATRYFSALKRQGTEAEMLIFPGEDHELTRAGRPRHRIERFDAILEWWHRHLPA
ncbi:S9 family peptidase [Microbacterium sp. P07]|uniref:S9 family peptidase n=1 Tax=Microbacterium sp. P07 TaxID=3366952 RepID=UPI003744B79A